MLAVLHPIVKIQRIVLLRYLFSFGFFFRLFLLHQFTEKKVPILILHSQDTQELCKHRRLQKRFTSLSSLVACLFNSSFFLSKCSQQYQGVFLAKL